MTNSRFSRLCPSHVLRLRGGRMVSVDSVLQRFLVARVVLGSLSALAFRVIVERQFLHHATATHVRGLQEQPRIPPCHIIRKAANLIIELFNLIRSDGWGYVVDSNLSTVDPHRNGGIGTRIRTKYEIDRRSRKTLFWKWTRWKSVGLVWCLTLIATAIDALGISQ